MRNACAPHVRGMMTYTQLYNHSVNHDGFLANLILHAHATISPQSVLVRKNSVQGQFV